MSEMRKGGIAMKRGGGRLKNERGKEKRKQRSGERCTVIYAYSWLAGSTFACCGLCALGLASFQHISSLVIRSNLFLSEPCKRVTHYSKSNRDDMG
jgi:hypothetical protein